MSERSVSATRASKKKSTQVNCLPKVNLSVQDRRHKTKLLNETQRRKDQLLGLTTYDVAAYLHRYMVSPSAVMDENRAGSAMPSIARPSQSSSDRHIPTGESAGLGTTSRPQASKGEEDANTRWHTQYAQHLRRRRSAAEHESSPSAVSSTSPHLNIGTSNDACDMDDAGTLPRPPSTYDEWVAAGCPTGLWAALLEEEVYAPMAAERAFLAAKYDPKGRGQPQAS
jgi:hypothetical protein